MLGVGALLVGRSTASYRIWDGIRSLDYLASRPEIDAEATRLHRRFRRRHADVLPDGTRRAHRLRGPGLLHHVTGTPLRHARPAGRGAEHHRPGRVRHGPRRLPHHARPRPTLILAATKDFFDIQGTWASFREAKQVYGLLGHPERVDIVEINAGHGYPKAHREAMVNWMRRWLLGKDGNVTEPEFAVYKPAELQCTRTGQVLEDFKGKSVVDLNVERERELAARRKKAWEAMTKEQQRMAVRKLLALPEKVPAAKKKVISEEKVDGAVIENVVFETEPGVLLPGRIYRPEKQRPESIHFLVDDGKLPMRKDASAEKDARGDFIKSASRGATVVILPLRGFGDTAPAKANPDKPSYLGVDVSEAFLAMHIGRPLLGQRIYDLLSVLGCFQEPKASVSIAGFRAAGPAALHAGFLQDGVYVMVGGSLASWSTVVRTPVSYDQLTNVVPGPSRCTTCRT